MNAVDLARKVTEQLAPWIPGLVTGNAGEMLGEGWVLAKKLWDKLQPAVDTEDSLKKAVNGFARTPDERHGVVVEVQLEELFEREASLRAEMASLLREAHGNAGIHQNAGARSFQSAGDVNHSVVILGDNSSASGYGTRG